MADNMIAALYVHPGGVYYGLDDVDPWDEVRDARLYAGPYPVIAHPPCQRWGRYWYGNPTIGHIYEKGDDDGCFASALAAVRAYGGVIEHPEASAAWKWHGLVPPQHSGGWYPAGDFIGWTCCVEQGHYGHRARKATWLYAVDCELPNLIWGKAENCIRLEADYHSAEERKRKIKSGTFHNLSKLQRIATPLPFRDILLDMARSVAR